MRNTNCDASNATMLDVTDDNNSSCSASGDSRAGTAFHKSSGRIWAFCKRNATSGNATIHYRNAKKKIAMEQYRNTNSEFNENYY